MDKWVLGQITDWERNGVLQVKLSPRAGDGVLQVKLSPRVGDGVLQVKLSPRVGDGVLQVTPTLQGRRWGPARNANPSGRIDVVGVLISTLFLEIGSLDFNHA
jgi:hypothetical protein